MATKSGKVPPGQAKKLQGTITAIEPFDVTADVKALQELLSTPSCEGALADFLTQRSNRQRQEIKQGYMQTAEKDLTEEINKVLPAGKFRDVVIALLDDGLQFAARALYKAMKGMGTDEKILVDVLCTRQRNVETEAIKETFKEMYNTDLSTMIKEDTSGPFGELLLVMEQASREEVPSANIESQARMDADALLKAGESRPSGPRDDAKFIEILGSRSLLQLNLATLKSYDEKSKKGGIVKYLESEKCGDVEDGYIALVKTAKGELVSFFTDRLYTGMKGIGTHDDLVIRILVSRSEIDLANIKDEFKVKYGKDLDAFIKDDTSGDYCNILLRILQGGKPASPQIL